MQIPTSVQVFHNLFLVYSESSGVLFAPLLGKLCSVDTEGILTIKNFIENGCPLDDKFYNFLNTNGFLDEVESPRISIDREYKSRDLTISLTSSCNLRCRYCYADGGIRNVDLSEDKIISAIHQLREYSHTIGFDSVDIGFHGTGESLVKFDTLVRTVNYTKKVFKKGPKINFSLVTNGTLISEKVAKFLKKNKFTVVLSFDGPEEIQNYLRPKADNTGSFNAVILGAKNLVKYKVPFDMRATVTGINQSSLVEFVELCGSIPCRFVSVSPVSITGRAEESGIEELEPEVFVHNYFLAKQRAKELGVELSIPSDYLDNVSARYCNGDGESMAVMPEGFISCCTRVTQSSDILSDLFFIGEFTSQGIEIWQDKVDNLKRYNLYNFNECDSCFVKFSCSGGCHHTRILNGGVQPESYCKVIKSILWNTLQEAVSS